MSDRTRALLPFTAYTAHASQLEAAAFPTEKNCCFLLQLITSSPLIPPYYLLFIVNRS